MKKLLLFTAMCTIFNVEASDSESLSIDRVISSAQVFAFPNDKNIKPVLSAFEVINYVPLSNELGERWAVITLSNTATGNRVLEHRHLQALLANGRRVKPQAFKINFEAKETQSVTVSFGKNKFPILSIVTNN